MLNTKIIIRVMKAEQDFNIPNTYSIASSHRASQINLKTASILKLMEVMKKLHLSTTLHVFTKLPSKIANLRQITQYIKFLQMHLNCPCHINIQQGFPIELVQYQYPPTYSNILVKNQKIKVLKRTYDHISLNPSFPATIIVVAISR